nr:hypothetical protein CFP56_03139 [Quercus suber]
MLRSTDSHGVTDSASTTLAEDVSGCGEDRTVSALSGHGMISVFFGLTAVRYVAGTLRSYCKAIPEP